MGKPFKIVISKSGTATSVFSDEMGLHKLGKATIHRATEVKFNNKEQWWEVISLPPYFVKEVLATGFSLRSDAIVWEVQYLNKNMEHIVENRRRNLARKKEICESAGC